MLVPPVAVIFSLFTTGVTIHDIINSDYEFLEVPLSNYKKFFLLLSHHNARTHQLSHHNARIHYPVAPSLPHHLYRVEVELGDLGDIFDVVRMIIEITTSVSS